MRTIELINLSSNANPEPVTSPGIMAQIEKNLSPNDFRPRIAFLTLGCKVNSSETEALAENFQKAGYALVEPNRICEPNVLVINTCTVTHIADRKSRQTLRRAKRENPKALVIAIGCYSNTNPEQVKALPEVDLVLGKAEQERMVEMVSERLNYELDFRPGFSRPLFDDGEIGNATDNRKVEKKHHTRAMVKIQDGCNAGCAFCIVPTARGIPKSVDISDVIESVRYKLEAGYKEVVLTGVHLGKYRASNRENEEHPLRLKALLETILEKLDIPRLRITSLEPQDYDPTLLELWQRDKRLTRHFHLALQSGNAATLARMRRGYTLEKYRQIVEQIHRELPDASITTDIIVGFPGETEQEFSETLAFAAEMGFAKIHVFPYSPRIGTLAASMPAQIADSVKKQRSERLRLLSNELSQKWRSRFLGEIRETLWEAKAPNSLIRSGLTDNYLRVYIQSDDNLRNQITSVRLVQLVGDGDADGLSGEIVR
ncbi:tRNA (N(6)-L-threonylcarbamoyladenosine(37)-C(2))-methylthiotransferase MtaB [Candidatus Chlorohelix sp.]|uniref:tRNA (N(6)-L-threonylcarbamoyladenosine(37)-C(2))- methylthiotransferase MtaB n=1 Tax=Candidatus Chlorohelix sp. TaxID=3139201 RepID=UPI003061DE22